MTHTKNWLFTPTSADLFFSKNDPQDVRLGELVKTTSIKDLNLQQSPLDAVMKHQCPHIIWGYPDDEGIVMNGGRPGAKDAPAMIRKFLYRMTPPVFADQISKNFALDLGDFNFTKSDLAERHEYGKDLSFHLYQQNFKTLSLGGGHDYGYPDAAGFLQSQLLKAKNSTDIKPVVINFDAHLDVRPTTHGFHSGTPFYRLLTEFPKQFHFIEVGIQDQCNSPHHKQWLTEQGGHSFDLNSLRSTTAFPSMLTGFQKRFENLVPKNTPAFISVDIDAFTSDSAPGCSQSWATGMTTSEFFPLFQYLNHYLKVEGLGIYEVSPALDHDSRTSKLAALIAYHYLFQQ
jgi:formiminoglutamase